jgi:hypothetical protein
VATAALGLWALVLAACGPAAAQSGLVLQVTATQPVYHVGETLGVSVTVVNPGLPLTVDFYVVAVLPDGVTAVSITPAGAVLGNLGNLASLAPVATGVPLGVPFTVERDAFFSYPWTGTEPLGPYQFYLAAVATGALADGALAPGDLVALETLTVTLAPPITATPDAARAQSATVTPDGGQVAATGADGTRFTLTVPAAALPAATPVTVTPLTAIANLPLGGPLLGAVRLEPAGLTFARPVTLTFTLPAPVDPAGLLGFLYQDAGASLEILTATVDGATVTLAFTHFTDAGLATATPTDFAAVIEPLLNGLAPVVSPQVAESLTAIMVAWFGRFGAAICQGTTLCQRVYQKAVASLDFHILATCLAVTAVVDQQNPYLAFQTLTPVARLAARLAELQDLAGALGLPSPGVAVPDLVCVDDLLGEIVTLARADGVARAIEVIAGTPPVPRVDAALLLLDDIGRNAALLDLFELRNEVEAALLDVLRDHVLPGAQPLCATEPFRADAVLFRPVQLFGLAQLNALEEGLGNAFAIAAAGCLVRLEPLLPTVATQGEVQFTATLLTPDGEEGDFEWTVDSCPGQIGPTSGLFTAGATAGTCLVTATRESPVLGSRQHFKSTAVTVADCPVGPLPARRAAHASGPVGQTDQCVAPIPVQTGASARLLLQAKVRPPNCASPALPLCDIFGHETTGSVSAAEPFHTVSPSDGAGQQASASGQAAASISTVVGPAGVVTISGSGSGSANAQYQGVFGVAEGTADATSSALADFTLAGPYSFAIQVTIDETRPTTTSVTLSGMHFEATGGASGVLPAGRHLVSMGARAIAVARLEVLSAALDVSVSFTLTLTPQ